MLLGLVQGLTEFFPISSSGHLVLGELLLGVDLHDERGAAVEVALHGGTLAAVVVFVWRDIWSLTRALFVAGEPDRAPKLRLVRALIVGSIPVGVVGMLFGDELETLFGDPVVAGFGFLITGALLIVSARVRGGARTAESVSTLDALLIGSAQLLAVTPGVSRSGSTIVAGMARGLTPREAGRFSFLIAVPVTAGAFLLKLPDILGIPRDELIALGLGALVAFASGLASLRFLVILLTRGRFAAFAWYVVPLGLATLLLAGSAPR